jgi:peptidoglycan-associated lipoprotein
MKSRRDRYVGFAMMFLLLVFSGACRKKVPPPQPTPPSAPPAAPSVSLTIEPSTIERGQSATLRWNSQNTTDLEIQPAVGMVEAQGTRPVSPTDSTTYTLTGRGPGGSTQATARLTVTVPPTPPAPAPPTRTPDLSLRERFDRGIKDAFFDYDSSNIRDDARSGLTTTAEFLRANPTVTVQVEGHCDERGSVAYNLGLGDRRANSARDFLVSLGISGDRVTTISYGKERPFCTDTSEQCWQQNRRAHVVCTNCGQ